MNWTHSNLVFALVDFFLVVVGYSISLGVRTLDPMVGDPSVFWTYLAVAMPFIIAIHLLTNLLAGAYGSRAGQTTAVVVAGFLSGVLLLVISFLARTAELGVVIPFTVIAVGAGLTLVGMSLARLSLRSGQWSGPP